MEIVVAEETSSVTPTPKSVRVNPFLEKNETEETKKLTTSELQRLVLLMQFKLLKKQLNE